MGELLCLEDVHDVCVKFGWIQDFFWFEELFFVDPNYSEDGLKGNLLDLSFFFPKVTDQLFKQFFHMIHQEEIVNF